MRLLLDTYYLYGLMAARELDTPLNHKDPFDELLLVQAQ